MNQSTPKPLPETTHKCIGPGHLDIVEERINQAIGIATAMFAALNSPEELPANTADAALGQIRLLEEAGEHLEQYYLDRAARLQRPGQPQRKS